MAFDQSTRNRLQKLVSDCRKLLSEEFSIQLQQTYGIDPNSGEVAGLDRLTHLSDRDRQIAQLLRDTLAHYLAIDEDDKAHRIAAIDRIIREQAFTVLNRLAALLMMEARGLLAAAVVSQGQQSQAFELYKMVTGSALGETGEAYRTFLFSLFDEFAIDLPALFDRYAAQGRLFPRVPALLEVLDALNHHEIQPLWAEDETIGWIYQYFNSKEERKAMRDASQAPRNSRELAVRNQFFTPRYVVEFLVDNTLGRMWFNATGGQTELRERCQYLLVTPDEQPQVSARLRDPRTLKLLDPACGSMHFGLYAFDLFLQLYQEAWDWEQTHGPGSLDVSTQPNAGLLPLCQTYADREAYQCDVPRLIVEHNIYGVDIDPRAAQIASLAVWLRAQRAWHDAGVKAQMRPDVGRGHVVSAVAPPAERELRRQFSTCLDHRDAELFEKTLQLLKKLPELGVLLQVERDLTSLIRQIYVGIGTGLFAVEEQESWNSAETRLRSALIQFSQATKSTFQGRLFANDALEGLRLIDLCRETFDVIVMNPPFGLPASGAKQYLIEKYPDTWKDIYAAFIERSFDMLRASGRLGAITPSMWQYTREMRALRKMLYDSGSPSILVELGGAVMDDAAVEAAVWTATKINEGDELWSLDLLNKQKSDRSELMLPSNNFWMRHQVDDFSKVAGAPYCHHLSKRLLRLWDGSERLSSVARIAAGNTTFDDFRFLRLWTEVVDADFSKWRAYRSGGEFQPFYAASKLRIFWDGEGASIRASGIAKHGSDAQVMQSSDLWGKAGLGYPRIGTLGLGIRVAPRGEIFSSGSVFIYPESEEDTLLLLGLLNSSLALSLFEAHGRHRKTETIALKDLPILPQNLYPVRDQIEYEAKQALRAVKNLESMDETNLNFISPWPSFEVGSLQSYSKVVYETVLKSSIKITDLITGCLDINLENAPPPDSINWNPLISQEEEARRIISYFVGVSFGRWEIPSGFPEVISSSEEDFFEPLPEFPEVMRKTIPADEYPVEIIEDDPLGSAGIVGNIYKLISDVFGAAAGDVEAFICQALKLADIQDYISKGNKFFSDHLKTYSGNRRQAPIYWPISSLYGGYTLWVYYPNLNAQTLFTAVNNFIDPKLEDVGKELQALRDKGANRSKQDEKRLEVLISLEHELADFRDNLLEIAPNYRPNQDDGVQITAAPLWKLFRHKPWHKVLKDTWAKLEKGDYDWAHLAMNYWPDRVRDKCVTDKSLAIAHNLEHLYIEPEIAPKKARGRAKKQDV